MLYKFPRIKLTIYIYVYIDHIYDIYTYDIYMIRMTP